MKRLYMMMTMTRKTVDMHLRNLRAVNKISANVCIHNSVLEQRRRRESVVGYILYVCIKVIWAADYHHVQRANG
jgi:lambda repressor-like predicted transcriptional regulator